MKKQVLLSAMLVLSVAALSGCQSPKEAERFQVITNVTQAAVSVTNVPTTAPTFYDPAQEEGLLENVTGALAEVTTAPVEITAVPTMNSIYAGATPVVIDPIDKPTATPVPAISFTNYATYDATALSLSFQAPAGWVVDESQPGFYTITNPDAAMTFRGFLTIGAQSTPSTYNKAALTKLVKDLLDDVKTNYGGTHWSTTKTADRTLLDATGVYADYSVTVNGSEVKGRVLASYLNGKVYTVHMASPAPYYETYKKSIFNKMRDSIKVTK